MSSAGYRFLDPAVDGQGSVTPSGLGTTRARCSTAIDRGSDSWMPRYRNASIGNRDLAALSSKSRHTGETTEDRSAPSARWADREVTSTSVAGLMLPRTASKNVQSQGGGLSTSQTATGATLRRVTSSADIGYRAGSSMVRFDWQSLQAADAPGLSPLKGFALVAAIPARMPP